MPIVLLSALVVYLLLKNRASKSTVAKSIVRELPPPDPGIINRVNSVPVDPKIAGAPVITADWYQPTDDLSDKGVMYARRMTIRQIQTAYNRIGAYLSVNGTWDLPTIQATWDYQNIHQNENSSTPLNVTGEMDILTQNSLQSFLGKQIVASLQNNPDIHVPGSAASVAYNNAKFAANPYLAL